MGLREALVARAEALEADNDWDEAVRDWRSAIDAVLPDFGNRHPRSPPQPGDNEALAFTTCDGTEGNLRNRWFNAQQQDKVWTERRDHAAVLELPTNLGQLSQEKRCDWLRKQHKKMARKWHPDKAKGNKDRAARKMNEVTEAKKALAPMFGC